MSYQLDKLYPNNPTDITTLPTVYAQEEERRKNIRTKTSRDWFTNDENLADSKLIYL
jgi:hypothetical protein